MDLKAQVFPLICPFFRTKLTFLYTWSGILVYLGEMELFQNADVWNLRNLLQTRPMSFHSPVVLRQLPVTVCVWLCAIMCFSLAGDTLQVLTRDAPVRAMFSLPIPFSIPQVRVSANTPIQYQCSLFSKFKICIPHGLEHHFLCKVTWCPPWLNQCKWMTLTRKTCI